jgi:predicted dehydrogenase
MIRCAERYNWSPKRLFEISLQSKEHNAMVYTCNWGILACGGIATKFCKDLLLDPKARGVSDVQHKIIAVASSSSKAKAADFVKNITDGKGDASIKTYGSYEELVVDKNVDIIYVASPHSHHYQHCLLCLRAGKNVLCEKSFVVNSKQSHHLIEIAREKKLFMMEAVWTRFFPIVLDIQKALFEDRVLGKVRRVMADFSVQFKPDPKHRMLNPDLAGGCLLDLGIYSLTMLMVMLFRHPDNKLTPPTVKSSMMLSKLTGVDEHTTLVLNFEEMGAQGIALSSLSQQSSHDLAVRVQGEKGELNFPAPICRPLEYTIALNGEKEVTKKFPVQGMGMFYEADACARCLRDGLLESDIMPLSETQLTMLIMDTARKQNDFVYPSSIEEVYL